MMIFSFQHSNNGTNHDENDDKEEDDNDDNDDEDEDNGDRDYHLCIPFNRAQQVPALGREGAG